MTDQPRITFNDGHAIPQLGFGTWQIPDAEASGVVAQAIAAGYLSIDTAQGYENEVGVGKAIAASDRPRSGLFVTTKLANSRHGYDETMRATEESLRKLRLDALDLYLVHWPIPNKDLYVETWRAFVELRKQGRLRSIGVSNFTMAHLERLKDETGIVPALNQIELHPRFQQRALRDYHAKTGIATESWSPLGRGRLLDDPVVLALAEKHRKTPAQVVLRWHLDQGLVVIPKSVTPSRIKENIEVFDFRLDAEDVGRMAGLDDPKGRTGPDPDTFG
ncbi:MAG TPA: aldo/keto reductase [Lichenihabitans sp.]|jgi:2,5-diketo-D-gluconate reductase A|nr:aldo/keto reductase [Lichenihabitans sp.]